MNYRDRMMNVQGTPTGSVHLYHGYNIGHSHARHSCAEIALEADTRIAELEAALELIANTDHVEAMLDPGRAVRVARAALNKAEGNDK